jgi:hypothetical protein
MQGKRFLGSEVLEIQDVLHHLLYGPFPTSSIVSRTSNILSCSILSAIW